MFRSILGITTAISLTLPMAAFGQSDARETVREVLDRYGYEPAQVDMLTNAQVAEIYLTATSDDAGDVRTVLMGMDLQSEPMAEGVMRTSSTEARVREVLADEGYDPEVIAVMSDAEIAEIYVAATSEDTPDLSGRLATMDLPGEGEMSGALGTTYDVGSNIARQVEERMQAMGYSQEQIDSLSDEEVAEIYLALTSNDMNEAQTVIDGALES